MIFEFTFQYGATSTKFIIIAICHFTSIYIPIWSYFYTYVATITIIKNSFTFQYGATSTILVNVLLTLPMYLHSNMELLLPALLFLPIAISQNLHSNMELLLPPMQTPYLHVPEIYIPIWSYFYCI